MTAALQAQMLNLHNRAFAMMAPGQVLAESPSVRPDAKVHLHSPLAVVTTIADVNAPERAELESFVRKMFKRVHSANVTHFMPKLMGLRDTQGKLLAVCGIRHAEETPLFLETYLDAPVEQVLSQHVGQTVERHSILEVGNLAVLEPSSVRSLISSVSVYLHSTHSDWAVFTGITTLRNSLTKLKMPMHTLGEATLSRLPEQERQAWGRYYDEHPQVMAIKRMQ